MSISLLLTPMHLISGEGVSELTREDENCRESGIIEGGKEPERVSESERERVSHFLSSFVTSNIIAILSQETKSLLNGYSPSK